MEKIDILGFALIVLGIFTFINILAIGSLFRAVEVLRTSLLDLVNVLDEINTRQDKINTKQGQFNTNVADEFDVIVKMISNISDNDSSSMGGQQK